MHTPKPIDNEKVHEQFIQWFEGNPFARIYCRSLPNKICSGACGNCKKERIYYQINKISELNKRNTNWDPDYDDVHGTAEEVWDTWINKINKAKEAIAKAQDHARSIEQASRERISATLQ